MVAFINATSKTHDDSDITVTVNADFNDFFKDKNQLKVTIYLGNSYMVMSADSWFSLNDRVFAAYGKALNEKACNPASIE